MLPIFIRQGSNFANTKYQINDKILQDKTQSGNKLINNRIINDSSQINNKSKIYKTDTGIDTFKKSENDNEETREVNQSQLMLLKESFDKLTVNMANILQFLHKDLPYFIDHKYSSDGMIKIIGDYINMSLIINYIPDDEKYVIYPFGEKFILENYKDMEVILTSNDENDETNTIRGDFCKKYGRYVMILSEEDVNNLKIPVEIKFTGNLIKF